MPKKAAPLALPDWLDAALWAEFLSHRKALKKPMTDYAQALAFKLLERIRAAGHDPADAINQSILNGWQGLFEPRAKGRGATQESFRERDQRLAAERLYEATGGNLGTPPVMTIQQPTQEIFDVTPSALGR